ncbi:MAG: hypothetical protein LBK82_16385 [Planctomycetaceae bacterium]|jgi:hypothetical protein|nr:hypothetical protein [Planctomycetaceae bacterium]
MPGNMTQSLNGLSQHGSLELFRKQFNNSKSKKNGSNAPLKPLRYCQSLTESQTTLYCISFADKVKSELVN